MSRYVNELVFVTLGCVRLGGRGRGQSTAPWRLATSNGLPSSYEASGCAWWLERKAVCFACVLEIE
jgi:hypothetical protein